MALTKEQEDKASKLGKAGLAAATGAGLMAGGAGALAALGNKQANDPRFTVKEADKTRAAMLRSQLKSAQSPINETEVEQKADKVYEGVMGEGQKAQTQALRSTLSGALPQEKQLEMYKAVAEKGMEERAKALGQGYENAAGEKRKDFAAAQDAITKETAELRKARTAKWSQSMKIGGVVIDKLSDAGLLDKALGIVGGAVGGAVGGPGGAALGKTLGTTAGDLIQGTEKDKEKDKEKEEDKPPVDPNVDVEEEEEKPEVEPEVEAAIEEEEAAESEDPDDYDDRVEGGRKDPTGVWSDEGENVRSSSRPDGEKMPRGVEIPVEEAMRNAGVEAIKERLGGGKGSMGEKEEGELELEGFEEPEDELEEVKEERLPDQRRKALAESLANPDKLPKLPSGSVLDIEDMNEHAWEIFGLNDPSSVNAVYIAAGFRPPNDAKVNTEELAKAKAQAEEKGSPLNLAMKALQSAVKKGTN